MGTIIWNSVLLLVLFIFYGLLFWIVIGIPTLWLVKKCIAKRSIDPVRVYPSLVSAFAVLAGLVAAILIATHATVARPFVAKLFTYPVTEVSVRFENPLMQDEVEELTTLFSRYADTQQKRSFKGFSISVQGGRDNPVSFDNGGLSHYLQTNKKGMSLFLSKPLSVAQVSELREWMYIWFEKKDQTNAKKFGSDVVLSMNPDDNSVLFEVLFEQKDHSKMSIEDRLRLYRNLVERMTYNSNKEEKPEFHFEDIYEVSDEAEKLIQVDVNSLVFRAAGFGVFGSEGRTAPADKCYAAFDITGKVWEDSIRNAAVTLTELQKELSPESAMTISDNQRQALAHLYKIRLKAILSNGQTYDAYLFSYEDRGDWRYSIVRTSDVPPDDPDNYKYLQTLIIAYETYDETFYDIDRIRNNCVAKIKKEKLLYTRYIQNMAPKKLAAQTGKINIEQKRFSPFYTSDISSVQE